MYSYGATVHLASRERRGADLSRSFLLRNPTTLRRCDATRRDVTNRSLDRWDLCCSVQVRSLFVVSEHCVDSIQLLILPAGNAAFKSIALHQNQNVPSDTRHRFFFFSFFSDFCPDACRVAASTHCCFDVDSTRLGCYFLNRNGKRRALRTATTQLSILSHLIL